MKFRSSMGLYIRVFLFLLLIFSAEIPAQNLRFIEFVNKRLQKEFSHGERGPITLAEVCSIETDPLARRVFWEYGSIFIADNDVQLPDTCIFATAEAVSAFQAKLRTQKGVIGSVEIELQKSAMEKLLKALNDAELSGLKITPLDGAIAGRRSFNDTVRLWNSRFYRALRYWTELGKIDPQEAALARELPTDKQVKKVVEWEAKGLYFSTNFSKSIFYSVAPPGTSQHLSLLAFDVVEGEDARVRGILNKHGWFQTIRTDKTHFTFLGVPESELPHRGLRNAYYRGVPFWLTYVEPVDTAESAR